LSALLQVVVKRDGKYHYQTYSQGRPLQDVVVIPEGKVAELFPEQHLRLLNHESGTMIKFVPDPVIFSTTTFSHKTLKETIKDRAYLMAGIYFQFIDSIQSTQEHFYFESGIRSLVEHINMDKKPIHDVIYTDKFWTDENTGKKIGVEVAMQYND